MKGIWHYYRPTMGVVIAVMITIGFSPAHAAESTEKPKTLPQASVFILPGLFDQPAKTLINLQQGRFKPARSALEFMIRWFPLVPGLEYDIQGDNARRKFSLQVLEKLSVAFERTYRSVKKIPQKKYLRIRKQYTELAPLIKNAIQALSQKPKTAKARPVPNKISGLIAVVNDKNTGWDPRLNVLRTLFSFDGEKPGLANPIGYKDPVAKLVNAWYAQGLAAGNYGDLYDNRDNGHSSLRRKSLPQMSAVLYGNEARTASMNYGLNTKIFYNAITIGNSSTARGGKFWRSQPRIALTTSGVPQLLYLQYISNHLYFYPEHRDHDPKFGDVMPANTPYMIISQGSSGTDRPFMRAVATILAAFQPEVKQFLKKAGLVMPTVQMIFRRGQKGIESDQDYLDGKAHPSVFRPENIDLLKMVKLANRLNIENVPPMVGIKMVKESGHDKNIDSMPKNLADKLFDTPGAITRIVRSLAYEKRMIVQAAYKGVAAPEGLSYHWVVLRGDAGRIKIISKNASNSLVEISVPWHERKVVPDQPDLTSDRVDIGVFVDNGKHLSAPAFISLMYPGHQKRLYNERKQILSVDYQYPDFKKRYTDPVLFPLRKWRDTFQYDLQGRLTGWKRQGADKPGDYTRHGAIIVERDNLGRTLKAQKIAYNTQPTSRGRPIVVIQRLPEYLLYQYANDKDRAGSIVTK